MKNIKYPLFLLMQLFVFQLVAQDQTVLNNGRSESATPSTPVVDQNNDVTYSNVLTEIDDADIPGTYYLRGSGDTTIYHGHEPIHLIERLDDMQIELDELRQQNELLANENQTIKMEMSSCCAEVAKGMDLPGSYLMQNSPNPFQTDTKIQFFIGENAEKAKVEVRNVDGILLKSYDLQQRGIGSMTLDRKDFANGSYVYTLSVDGKIVDSKVMILQ